MILCFCLDQKRSSRIKCYILMCYNSIGSYLQAARSGNVDMTRMLLDHGAIRSQQVDSLHASWPLIQNYMRPFDPNPLTQNFLFISFSLSLSLSLYIYIYIYISEIGLTFKFRSKFF